MTYNTPYLQSWRQCLEISLNEGTARNTRELFREMNPHIDVSPVIPDDLTGWKEAAILFPVIDRRPDPTVVFTVRSASMPSHAGQISFPGGKAQDEDNGAIATALRESREEIGLPPEAVDVIGTSGVHFGGAGFAVTPVIGIIPPDIPFQQCSREVEEIFEVPLPFLMDKANNIIEEREAKGVKYKMFAIPYKDYHIWGLTAGIIHSLSTVMDEHGIT